MTSGRDARPNPAPSPEEALKRVRQRFIDGFSDRVAGLSALVRALDDDSGTSARPLREMSHRLAGLAGTIGFPVAGQHAAALERLSVASPFDAISARQELELMRAAFERERAVLPAWWVADDHDTASGLVLLVEDDPEQRQMLTSGLAAGGFRVTTLTSGDGVVATMRLERPDVVLLDVDLPNLDGHAVCRLLKSDAELASVPVVFVSVRVSPDDRVRGLMLGADDYVAKPVDVRELLIRLKRLMTVPKSPAWDGSGPATALDYETFVAAAAEMLNRDGAALALVRVPATSAAAALASIVAQSRRMDLVGVHDPSHAVVLMPNLSMAAAERGLEAVVSRLREEMGRAVWAGLTVTAAAGADLKQMLADADDALAAARYLDHPVSTGASSAQSAAVARSVVIAEDDPDVLGVVDAQFRGAGFRTELVFDGDAAVERVQAVAPDLLILDLMMPGLTGFEVLARLQRLQPADRPHVIVLSAKNREQDVLRAFELGADDYVTKPFNPPELIMRASRLVGR